MIIKGKILVIDDEEHNLVYFKKLFEKEGYEFETAKTSEEALKILSISSKPDLILLDIVLQNESGLDLLKKIKEDTENEFIYVVMITGKLKSSDDQAKGIELGADGYLTRPIQNRELLARINAFFRHKRSIDELKRSESRFKTIIQKTPDAILIVEKDGKVKFANPAAEDLFKLSIDVLLKKTFGYPIVKGEHTEIKIVRHDNLDVTGEMRTIDIEWDEARTFLTTIRDITDKKQLWEELLKAKEKAEESEKLKAAFLANMSHEIRTPMNSIIGFIELLLDPDLAGDTHDRFLHAVKRSSERLLDTINAIIEVSKIEAGQSTVSVSDTNITELLLSLHDMFNTEAESRGITLKLKYPSKAENTVIRTDRVKLESILINLIKNALKFTNEGQVDFGFCTKKNKLEFFIQDTGIGIPDNKKRKIFDRFIQADSHLTSSYEGSGLGLSISKAYVTMLGGEIWVESEVNKGSVFKFTINYEPAALAAEKNGTTRMIAKELDGTILLVEDEEDNYQFFNTVLTNNRFKNIHVISGLEAISAVKTIESIALILMDIKLPEMDGLEATKEIKKIRPNLPIIAVTAYALTGDKKRILDAGCDDYIAKPIQQRELIEIINKHIP